MKKSGLADSPFFQTSSTSLDKGREVFDAASTARSNERTNEDANVRTENRSLFRTVDLPQKRLTKRYSFEFYEDQIIALKQLRVRAELDGRNLNLSQLVRHALDLFLEQHK